MNVPNRVLITGGAHGIGFAIAERCREDGYLPVILDSDGADSIRCDLADPESTREALKLALQDGPVTRLVNNVGALTPAMLEDETVEQFDATVAINLRSSFLCAQALIPGMKEARFGRVVSISSRAAFGKEKRTSYSATKAGMQGMSRTWALETASYGVTVNTVSPGPISTELFRNANPYESPHTEHIIRSIPVQRMGTPQDVSNAVSFLLNARTSFITGQNINVCGGMTVGVSHG